MTLMQMSEIFFAVVVLKENTFHNYKRGLLMLYWNSLIGVQVDNVTILDDLQEYKSVKHDGMHVLSDIIYL